MEPAQKKQKKGYVRKNEPFTLEQTFGTRFIFAHSFQPLLIVKNREAADTRMRLEFKMNVKSSSSPTSLYEE